MKIMHLLAAGGTEASKRCVKTMQSIPLMIILLSLYGEKTGLHILK